MSSLNPPAPHPLHIHSTSPSPLDTSTSLLQAFLSRATIDPSLRPDSTLSSRGDGPQSNSGGTGSNVNLTLWHLERILKGLQGEDLGVGKARDVLGKIEQAEGEGEERGKQRRKKMEVGKGVNTVPKVVVGGGGDGGEGVVEGEGVGDGTTADEWQDRVEFEREQDVIDGELGERDMEIPDAEVPEEVVVGGQDEMEVEDDGEGGMLDAAVKEAREEIKGKKMSGKEKDERKKAKKERRKEEKKAKEKVRKG